MSWICFITFTLDFMWWNLVSGLLHENMWWNHVSLVSPSIVCELISFTWMRKCDEILICFWWNFETRLSVSTTWVTCAKPGYLYRNWSYMMKLKFWKLVFLVKIKLDETFVSPWRTNKFCCHENGSSVIHEMLKMSSARIVVVEQVF